MSTQKPQDQYVKVGDINTRFWAAGDKGTAVILLHPGSGAVENWEHNINALAQHHRIYAIDSVGAGRSDKPKLPSKGDNLLAYLAQHVNDFMETQGIDRASLVGNCGGGWVSLGFALQFPEKLEKLVLVDSWGLGNDIPFFLRLGTLPLIGELLLRPSRRLTAMVWKMGVYDPTLITEEMVDIFYRLSSLPGAQKSLLSGFRAIQNLRGAHTDVISYITDNLANITAPTLIIWGKQDRLRPVDHAYVAKERIPNSELHIFDRCGHIPEFECPEEFNKLVLEFLAR